MSTPPILPSLITVNHHRLFGCIIDAFARIEVGLQATIALISDIDLGKISVLTRGLSYTAKRDTLYSYMEIAEIADPIKSQIKSFFDAAHEYSGLRNHIAHSIWTEGTRPGSIKPRSIKIQGGKGKVIGSDPAECDYTETELERICHKLGMMHNSYLTFLRTSGLSAAIDAKTFDTMSSTTDRTGADAK
jgi:hypothetical protein